MIGTMCAVHAQTNVIGTTGNVLIGSTTDNNTGEKLQVTGPTGITGNLSVGNTSTFNSISLFGNNSGTGGGTGISIFNGTNNIGFIGNYSLNVGGPYDPRFTIQSNVGAGLYLNPAGQNVIVKGSTDDGVNALQVTGSTSISSNLKVAGALQCYGPGNSLTNTVIGDFALSSNTTGSWNVAIGMGAGQLFQTGQYNVFVGGQAAGIGTGTGSYNNAIGFSALRNLSSGAYNNAFGAGAGSGITTGISNTMMGDASGIYVTTASNNTGIGYGAGMSANGANWTALGAYALKDGGIAARDGCTAIGEQALQITTGSYNTAIGIKAGYDINTGGTLTGSYNSYLGAYAGQGNISGSYNTFIGYNSSLGSVNNYVVIADGQGHNRIVSDNNGNVGIGTNTPAVPLDVIGSAQFTNTITTKGLSGLFFGDSGTYNQYSGIYPSNGANDINIKGYASSTIHFGFGNTTGANMSALEAMTIKDNGHVGIGTTTPGSLLHIKNLGATASFIQLTQAANSPNVDIYSNYDGSDDLQTGSFGYGVRPTDQAWEIWEKHTTGNWSNLITVKKNGNVGIGTTDNANWQLANSTYKLAVAGNAVAESMTVKLQANWPDYTFKKEYRLMSLADVKTYIDKNQHLPEIPSAAQVEKDGINLGEMNRLLLKKVEELTLYLIEKDKEIKELKSSENERIKKLEQRLQLLEKQ